MVGKYVSMYSKVGCTYVVLNNIMNAIIVRSHMLKSNRHFGISTYGTCSDLATTTLVESGMLYFEKTVVFAGFVPPDPLTMRS